MKKYKNLVEYYKLKKIGLLIFPITSVMLFILAIIFMVNMSQILWLGAIIIMMSIVFVISYIIALISINNYIKKLENEETMKKELEEELKKSKNSKQ